MPVDQLVSHPLGFRRTTRNQEPSACLPAHHTEKKKKKGTSAAVYQTRWKETVPPRCWLIWHPRTVTHALIAGKSLQQTPTTTKLLWRWKCERRLDQNLWGWHGLFLLGLQQTGAFPSNEQSPARKGSQSIKWPPLSQSNTCVSS